MLRRHLTRLTIGLGMLTANARSVGAQLRPMPVGIPRLAPEARKSATANTPSVLGLGVRSIGWASYGAVLGGSLGFIIDDEYCKRHHGDEPSGWFGPCFAYTGTGSATGWFGGAVVGATFAASRVARKRGCPARAAGARAFAGAMLGALPGLKAVAHRPGKYPPGRSALVFGAPLLAGTGAALAVLGCRS
jgi:hypothetical protein